MAFLNAKLPSRFKAASGEIVDIGGTRSAQTDVIVYDAHANAPLVIEDDNRILIGAEAVLVVIEVIGGVEKIRKLRPWGQEWARYRPRGKEADEGPRCFTSVLAFSTNLGQKEWSSKELGRIREECTKEALPAEHIDRIAVLSRGLVLPADGLVVSNESDRRVLGMWYSALLNFLTRRSEGTSLGVSRARSRFTFPPSRNPKAGDPALRC